MNKLFFGMPLSGVDEVCEAIEENGHKVEWEYDSEKEYSDTILGGSEVSEAWKKIIEDRGKDGWEYYYVYDAPSDWVDRIRAWVAQIAAIKNEGDITPELFKSPLAGDLTRPDRTLALHFDNFRKSMYKFARKHEVQIEPVDLSNNKSLAWLDIEFGVRIEQPKDEKRSFGTKLFRFLQERNNWVKAGKPLRTDERIAQIYNKDCKPCTHFDNDSCGVCGCRIKESGTVLNKLAWATTECPIGKWQSEHEQLREPAKMIKITEKAKGKKVEIKERSNRCCGN